ncbi:MAG: hypothetical protein ACI86M_002075 [Saprospiraceae bacterium]|jgi:hypothetical protein
MNEKILVCNTKDSKTKCEKYSKVQDKLDNGYTLGPWVNNFLKTIIEILDFTLLKMN